MIPGKPDVMSLGPAFKRSAAVVLLAACMMTQSAGAASVRALDVRALMRGSELVFEGRPTITRVVKDPASGLIWTEVDFEVVDVVKGRRPSGPLTLSFLGGVADGRGLWVSDMNIPEVDERGIYFVESVSRRQVNPLLGWSQGHFKRMKTPTGPGCVTTFDGRPVMDVVPEPESTSAALSTGVARGLRLGTRSNCGNGLTAARFKKTLTEINSVADSDAQ